MAALDRAVIACELENADRQRSAERHSCWLFRPARSALARIGRERTRAIRPSARRRHNLTRNASGSPDPYVRALRLSNLTEIDLCSIAQPFRMAQSRS